MAKEIKANIEGLGITEHIVFNVCSASLPMFKNIIESQCRYKYITERIRGIFVFIL